MVGEPHRPNHAGLDEDVGRSDMRPHLIELSVVDHRPVTAQTPRRFEAQDPIQIPARWGRPM